MTPWHWTAAIAAGLFVAGVLWLAWEIRHAPLVGPEDDL